MKGILLVLTLGGLLALAIAVAVYVWFGMSDVDLSTNGVIALILGVVATLALGVGLMSLVFYSHRSGHDRVGGAEDRTPSGEHDRDGGGRRDER